MWQEREYFWQSTLEGDLGLHSPSRSYHPTAWYSEPHQYSQLRYVPQTGFWKGLQSGKWLRLQFQVKHRYVDIFWLQYSGQTGYSIFRQYEKMQLTLYRFSGPAWLIVSWQTVMLDTLSLVDWIIFTIWVFRWGNAGDYSLDWSWEPSMVTQ